jgi:hypothetical protein
MEKKNLKTTNFFSKLSKNIIKNIIFEYLPDVNFNRMIINFYEDVINNKKDLLVYENKEALIFDLYDVYQKNYNKIWDDCGSMFDDLWYLLYSDEDYELDEETGFLYLPLFKFKRFLNRFLNLVALEHFHNPINYFIYLN